MKHTHYIDHVPTIATAAAALIGWLCVTAAIAQLAPARIVWPLSIGVLCLSVPGFRPLRVIFAEGLFSLMQDPQESDDA
jgi:hypothetical protein